MCTDARFLRLCASIQDCVLVFFYSKLGACITLLILLFIEFESKCLMPCKYSPLGNPRGRYDEHSSKSSLSCETKVYRTSRRMLNFRRWCLLASRHSRQWRQKTCWCVVDVWASSPSSNVKSAHNTTKNFAPNLRWGYQSHRFAVNKGLSA
jgi:hypothetical protein